MNFILIMFALSYIYTRFGHAIPRNTLNCGLAGYSGDGASPHELTTLLLYAEMRGKDSVGVYSNNRTLKAAGGVRPFITGNTENFVKMTKDSELVMLHTRAATMGQTTAENAHPYRFTPKTRPDTVKFDKDVIGTHNGWLFPTYLQDMADEHGIDMPNIDSKLIYEILIANEMDYNSLTTIEGTMALAFVVQNVLHLYRRTSKPLYFGAKGKGIYYSSVEDALFTIGCVNIQEATPNLMYRFDKGELLDVTYVGDAKIVKDLPTDVSPSMWRQAAGYESSNKIPHLVKSARGKGAYYQQWENQKGHREKRKNAFQAVTNSKKGAGNLKDATFLNGKLLGGHEEFELAKENKAFKTWAADAKDTFIIIQAIDHKTKAKMEGQVFVSDHAKGFAITNHLGFAVMHFDKFEGETRIYTGDTSTTKVMYSALINIKKGRVLEVTLNIPFRLPQKALEQNAGHAKQIGFNLDAQRLADREAEDVDFTDVEDKPAESGKGVDSNVGNGSEDKKTGHNTGSTETRYSTCEDKDGAGKACGNAPFTPAASLASTELTNQELCNLFGVSLVTPNHALARMEVMNKELVSVQEEIEFLRISMDIGGDLEDDERIATAKKLTEAEDTEYKMNKSLDDVIQRHKKSNWE